MGSTAIRSVTAFPGLELSGVITSTPDKEGMDAAAFAGLDAPTGVTATTDVEAVLSLSDAVAYMASGDIRPDDAVNDIERCLRAGVLVVTPSLYSLSVESIPAGPTTHWPSWSQDCVRASVPSRAGRSSTTRPTTSPTRSGCRAGSAVRWTTCP
jgi:hypothetical protein